MIGNKHQPLVKYCKIFGCDWWCYLFYQKLLKVTSFYFSCTESYSLDCPLISLESTKPFKVLVWWQSPRFCWPTIKWHFYNLHACQHAHAQLLMTSLWASNTSDWPVCSGLFMGVSVVLGRMFTQDLHCVICMHLSLWVQTHLLWICADSSGKISAEWNNCITLSLVLRAMFLTYAMAGKLPDKELPLK